MDEERRGRHFNKHVMGRRKKKKKKKRNGPVDCKGPFEIILELLLEPFRDMGNSSGVGGGDRESREGRAEG